MRQTHYFLPLLKEDPSHAEVISHKLMLRSAMIMQQNSGIYSWLPLGLKVLNKIAAIIRKEMDEAGALEMLMPCLQPAELWEESGRYDSYGKEMLRIKDRHDNRLLFGPTNEEVVHDVVRSHVRSYRALPLILYQIQWKFRDEIRPRFGLLRGREFLMKDGYSFDVDIKSAEASYDLMMSTYIKIFKALGVTALPLRAETGPVGGSLSHEFHVLSSTGESTAYFEPSLMEEALSPTPNVSRIKSLQGVTDDLYDAETMSHLTSHRGIEVGHIFCYDTKYSKPMNATFTLNTGRNECFSGGCYGIGVSRLVSAVIEASHDQRGIIWPEAIAPFDVHLVNLHVNDENSCRTADQLYESLKHLGKDVLYDDRDERPGLKLASSDLIGIPVQIVVSKNLSSSESVELRSRKTGSSDVVSVRTVLDRQLGC